MIFPFDDLPLFDDDFDDEQDFFIVPVGKPTDDFVPEARYTLFQNLNLVQQRTIGVSDSVADLLDTIWWSHVRSMFDDYDDWRYGYTVVVYDDTEDVRLNISLEYLIECVYRIAFALDDTTMMETIESHWQVEPIDLTNFWDNDLLEPTEVMLMLADMLWLNHLPDIVRLDSICFDLVNTVQVIIEDCYIQAVLIPHLTALDDIGLTLEQVNSVALYDSEVWVNPFIKSLSTHSDTFYIRIK